MYAPSPCGVLVLKKQEKKDYLREYVSFRPLAGFWFLNLICCGGSDVDSACFRPLAGVPYLSFPRRYGGSGEHREPMGDGASTHNIRPLSSALRITPTSAISCIAR